MTASDGAVVSTVTLPIDIVRSIPTLDKNLSDSKIVATSLGVLCVMKTRLYYKGNRVS